MQKGKASTERDEKRCLQQCSQTHSTAVGALHYPETVNSRTALGTKHLELLHHVYIFFYIYLYIYTVGWKLTNLPRCGKCKFESWQVEAKMQSCSAT